MLKRIKVENFKSIKKLDYTCANLNLLMGVNGAGKSSFIQFLLLLKSLSKEPLKASVCVQDNSEKLPVKFDDVLYSYAMRPRGIMVNVEFSNRPPRGFGILNFCRDNGRPWIGVPRELDPSDEEDRALLKDYKPRVHSVSRFIYRGEGHKDIWIEDLEYLRRCFASRQHKDLREFKEEYGDGDLIDRENDPDLYDRYCSIRDATSKNNEKIASRINAIEKKKASDYEKLWDHMRYIEAFREKPQEVHKGLWHGWQENELLSNGKDIVEYLYAAEEDSLKEGNPMIFPNCPDKLRLIDQVNAWLQVVSPGAQIKISKCEVEDSNQFIQSVAYGRPGCEHEFKPQSVGFGISYVLPVLVALLTAQPNDIVIIENPEAHLHPRGQAEMGNLIARAAAYGVQVFVETHSDHVINGVRVAVKKGIVKPDDVNIAFFERKGHEVEAEDGSKHKEYYADVRNIKIDANGSLSEYPEDFLDEWSNQLLRLMKPRTK